MDPDAALFATCLLLAMLIALPGVQAVGRRRASREASEVAAALVEFAAAVRREQKCLPPDDVLLARVGGVDIPEAVTFHFARQLSSPDPALLADAAQRLALRLKRRVAFERKMLARTAAGRRRGALAAAAPGVTMLALRVAGIALPLGALLLLLSIEALGCWLLWRAARVEV
jgi:hypothetical protein